MRYIRALFVAALILALVTGAWVYSGVYDVAADTPHTRPVSVALAKLKHRAISTRAAEIEVPELDREALAIAGAGHYDAMCKACHLAPGMSRTDLSRGLYPAPPVFPEGVAHGPGYNFWAIKHGIKLTGMPAWGETHDDDAIWGLVAFLERLPELSAGDYDRMVESAGAGHAEDGHEH